MQPGTVGGGYVSHSPLSRCQKLIIKRALKLSLAVAVFSAFLCLPLAVGWVNCSDSGAIVRCERAMEARGPPRTGGSLARRCRLPRHHGRRAVCGAGHGQGSAAAPRWPGDGPCPSHSILGSVSAHPLSPLGNLPTGAFGNRLEMAGFVGSETSGLPSPSRGEGVGADVGDVSCGWCLPGPNPSSAGPPPPHATAEPPCPRLRQRRGEQRLSVPGAVTGGSGKPRPGWAAGWSSRGCCSPLMGSCSAT